MIHFNVSRDITEINNLLSKKLPRDALLDAKYYVFKTSYKYS